MCEGQRCGGALLEGRGGEITFVEPGVKEFSITMAEHSKGRVNADGRWVTEEKRTWSLE